MAELSVTRFAETLAHIEHFGGEHVAEVLERLSVQASEFEQAGSLIPLTLAEAAKNGQMDAVKAFGDTLTATKATLTATKPKLEDIGPRRSPGSPPARPPAPGAGADTTLDPVSARSRGAALPFKRAGAVPPPAAHPVEPDRSGRTVALSASAGAAEATPFEARELDAWTVERYAAFVADRRAGDIDAVRKEYDVSGEAFEQALLANMNRRFGADPSLRARWLALIVERDRQMKRG
jgi:hypothetical protein